MSITVWFCSVTSFFLLTVLDKSDFSIDLKKKSGNMPLVLNFGKNVNFCVVVVELTVVHLPPRELDACW